MKPEYLDENMLLLRYNTTFETIRTWMGDKYTPYPQPEMIDGRELWDFRDVAVWEAHRELFTLQESLERFYHEAGVVLSRLHSL